MHACSKCHYGDMSRRYPCAVKRTDRLSLHVRIICAARPDKLGIIILKPLECYSVTGSNTVRTLRCIILQRINQDHTLTAVRIFFTVYFTGRMIVKFLLAAATQAHKVEASKKGAFSIRLPDSNEIFTADRVFPKLVRECIQQFICRGHAGFGRALAFSEFPVDINRIGAERKFSYIAETGNGINTRSIGIVAYLA